MFSWIPKYCETPQTFCLEGSLKWPGILISRSVYILYYGYAQNPLMIIIFALNIAEAAAAKMAA